MEGVLALMIPIVAILVWSPVGRSIAHAIHAGAEEAAGSSGPEIEALKIRVAELEARLGEQAAQVHQLQENTEFYKQLLESKSESKTLKES